MLRTTPSRLLPLKECLAHDIRATAPGQLAGIGIDLAKNDAVGHAKLRGSAPAERPSHETGPDRQRRAGTGQVERTWLVETDPYDRQQVGRVAGKPGVVEVVGGTGLAGCRTGESETPHAPTGTSIEYAFEHVG